MLKGREDVFMRGRRLNRLKIAVGVAIPLAAGCWWQRPEDARAPREYYDQWIKPAAECERPIRVFPAGTAPGRPSRELANISATCYPGALEICERRLKERACALGADALLLAESEPSPHPAAPSRISFVSRSGRAVRWED